MNNETNKSGEGTLGSVMSCAGLIISGLGLLEISQMDGPHKNFLFIAIAVLFVVSCICIFLKQDILGAIVVILATLLFLYAKFGTTVIIPPPTSEKPGGNENSGTVEWVEPPVKDTEAKIQIDFEVYCKDNNGTTARLGIDGETAGRKPEWYSSDYNIIDVNSNGTITAKAAGNATVTAVIQYDGETYYDEIEIAVNDSAVDEKIYKITYVDSIPYGIDTGDRSFKNLVNSYDLYGSEQEGLNAIREDKCSLYSTGVNIGYIYYHWCRGEYDNPQLEIVESHINDGYPYYYNHNRASNKEETSELHSFSCFFSTEAPSVECRDGSGCYWYESSGVCNDSFWFWAIPVYQAEYVGFNTELSISIYG